MELVFFQSDPIDMRRGQAEGALRHVIREGHFVGREVSSRASLQLLWLSICLEIQLDSGFLMRCRQPSCGATCIAQISSHSMTIMARLEAAVICTLV